MSLVSALPVRLNSDQRSCNSGVSIRSFIRLGVAENQQCVLLNLSSTIVATNVGSIPDLDLGQGNKRLMEPRSAS